MIDIIIYIIAFFVTVPFMATWVVYVIATKVTDHKLRAFHLSIEWTTICYIIAALTLCTIYFDRLFAGVISVVLLIVLSAVIIYQWKSLDVNFAKAVKFLSRFCFLFFSFIYICFIFFGIGLYIIGH